MVSKAPVVFKVYPVLMALLDHKVYLEMLAPKDPLVLMAPRVFKVSKVLLVLELISGATLPLLLIYLLAQLKVMPTSFKQMTACAYGIRLHLLG
jgi:hypothetical protein